MISSTLGEQGVSDQWLDALWSSHTERMVNACARAHAIVLAGGLLSAPTKTRTEKGSAGTAQISGGPFSLHRYASVCACVRACVCACVCMCVCVCVS